MDPDLDPHWDPELPTPNGLQTNKQTRNRHLCIYIYICVYIYIYRQREIYLYGSFDVVSFDVVSLLSICKEPLGATAMVWSQIGPLWSHRAIHKGHIFNKS